MVSYSLLRAQGFCVWDASLDGLRDGVFKLECFGAGLLKCKLWKMNKLQFYPTSFGQQFSPLYREGVVFCPRMNRKALDAGAFV